MVVDVAYGGPAQKAGIAPAVAIVAVNNRQFTPTVLREAVAGDGVRNQAAGVADQDRRVLRNAPHRLSRRRKIPPPGARPGGSGPADRRFSSRWRNTRTLHWLPAPGEFSECLLMDRPVMQGGRIKVRSVGPHQRLDFRINPNLIEQLQVAQGAVQFACQNGSKVDRLFRSIVKTNAERVSRNDFERANSINRMTHETTYFNGSMGAGFRPSCSRCQSALSSS